MNITVIDYGIGNILSVIRALKHCGADFMVTDSPEDIQKARSLILPGVGAFEDGMKGLSQRNLLEPIKEYTSQGYPFLGICLGMQMMMDASEEFGVHMGLGLIPGRVTKILDITLEGEKQKIPHIGWNRITIPESKRESGWGDTILSGLEENSEVFFVHSYAAIPNNNEHRLADTYYGGRQITAAIKKGNLYGCQFHPEKSGEVGLRIITNFTQIS